MTPNDPQQAARELPPGGDGGAPTPAAASRSPRDRIIEALMELAAEREWDDFGIADVATRAGLSLGEFREAFPSKGAVLAGFSRKIDLAVLAAAGTALADEAPRERLFDVLMRRLDAMAPYRLALQSIAEWVRRDPLAAAALNGVATNSMRFMLASAGIDAEGATGAIKLQGLVLAWLRVCDAWFEDEDPGLARTMAALDKELARGETWVARVEDLDRLVSPLRLIGRTLMDARRNQRNRKSKLRPEPADADGDQIV